MRRALFRYLIDDICQRSTRRVRKVGLRGGEGGKGIVQITGDSASPPLRKRSREEEKWPSCSGRFYRLSALCAAEREHCAYRHGPKSNTFMRG